MKRKFLTKRKFVEIDDGPPRASRARKAARLLAHGPRPPGAGPAAREEARAQLQAIRRNGREWAALLPKLRGHVIEAVLEGGGRRSIQIVLGSVRTAATTEDPQRTVSRASAPACWLMHVGVDDHRFAENSIALSSRGRTRRGWAASAAAGAATRMGPRRAPGEAWAVSR